ncbi:hypothetical protein ASG25_00640 [Rhizobium sp. Leaf384]|uniref:OmpA family protein n=1 Tax=unclassified Rhizobium TaxID=2613769 RepID=UPI0007131569|nr:MULTISPECIES: OmpA family protein [unclassified Rhizobium]KQS74446.1 hypothetical protein ASG58_15835 [Rhizobium sp. Leaf383]KQS80184.1 hypothetical protein ASG25_00640 [Rhizobium sp. Leaf384]
MTIRSKLFATVAMPLLAMTVGLQPALADAQIKSFQLAQADEDELLRKRKPVEGQEESAPNGGAEPSENGEGRQKREERRKDRDSDQQQGEGKKQREAEPSSGLDAQPRREERRKQRDSEQQNPSDEQPQAQPSGEDAPRPSREERRKQRDAEQQKQNDEQPQAQSSGEDAPRPSREERRKQRDAEQQKQSDEQPQAEPSGEATPRQSREERRKQRDAEQQKTEEQQKKAGADANDAAKTGDSDAAGQPKADEDAERKRQREERIRKREAERLQGQQDGEQQAKPGDSAEQPAAAEMTDEERARLRAERRKQREAEGQGTDDPARPRDAQDAGTNADQAGDDGANRDRPVVDKRSREEREKLARDPSKSDETVVLPVENGAAVLDSDKDADNRDGDSRDRRRREREQVREERDNQPPPRTDADAQSEHRERRPDREELNAAINERGRRIDQAPEFDARDLIDALTGQRPRIEETRNNRTVLDFGDEIVVRSDDRPRLRRDARETSYEELPRGRTREVIERPNGMRVVTIYNRYGDVIQRTRINRDGEEYLMVYAPEVDEEKRPPLYDVGEDLPPMRLTVPVRDYIIDTSTEPDRDYYDFLAEPPVERVERTYSLDEVRNSARIRDKVRRIDLDTITFATGSAEVPTSQAKTLRKVADAMLEVIDKDPGETFLIEGHTDAVGSDQSNLVLSDERAESVAALLTDIYEIPPENLVTQGYGERFLKVRTSEAEQENRRVTIRRVTPLVRPVAQK